MKEVKKPSDIPVGKSYIIQFHLKASHYVPPYDSRDTGGYETTDEIRQFVTPDEKEWRQAIESLYVLDNRTDVVAFVCEKANIQTKVVVGLSLG
jgi:hypothetical protein